MNESGSYYLINVNSNITKQCEHEYRSPQS